MKVENFTQDYSLKGLQTILKRDIERGIKKIKANKYTIIICLCLCKLILQVFSLTTLATFACLFYSLRSLFLQKKEEILEKGLAYYMPLSIKNALLNRSLLDMLCDMWFIPTLSVYIKTIMAPLLSTKPRGPEDAVKYLDPLEPKAREVFIRKGLAFLFPRSITKVILPRDYFQNPLIERALHKRESFLSYDQDESDLETSTVVPRTTQKRISRPNPFEMKSIDFQAEGSSKTMDSSPHGSASANKKNLIQVIDVANPAASSPTIKKSKVLLSSHILRNMQNMPGRLDPAWDNMHEYQRLKNHKPITRSHSNNKLSVLNLVMGLKQFEFMKGVSKGTAYKISGVSAVALLAQLILFKRTRKWTLNLLLFLTFSGGVSILIGSLAYLYVTKKLSSSPRSSVHKTPSQLDFQLALQARQQEEEMASE
jgi:hypothetical protein